MKNETLKEAGLAREPCVSICKPITESELKETMHNPEWEKRLTGK